MKNCYICGQAIPKGHHLEHSAEIFPSSPDGMQHDPPAERQVREQTVPALIERPLPPHQPDLIKENPS